MVIQLSELTSGDHGSYEKLRPTLRTYILGVLFAFSLHRSTHLRRFRPILPHSD